MDIRKIASKEDEAKKRRRNQFIVGGVLIVVMLFSTIGYALQGNGDSSTNSDIKINYNGHDFVYQNGIWNLKIGQVNFGFLYNPTHTERIQSELNSADSYANKPLYISSVNPTAEQEIYRNLDQIVLRRQYACLEGSECSGDLPVKNCQEDNFIIIREDTVKNIIQEGTCVYIIGNYSELPKLTDEFLFKIIGVD